jgi:putative ABC transport system permease protein
MEADTLKPRLKSLTHGYLKAMGATLVSGRHLDGRDDATAPVAAVVNRSIVHKYFGDANPVGTTMVWRPGKIEVPVEIVGVVEDVRQNRIAAPTYPEIFVDYRQVMAVFQRMGAPKQRLEQITFGFMSFGVRTHGDPRALIPRVRDIVRATDANATIDAIHPMEQMVGYSMARQKFYAVLLGTFAAVAGLLAAIGIYGVLAYSVVQRTQEIGVRMALGASAASVFRLVLGQALRLVFIGVGAGLVAAGVLTRLIERLLYQTEPLDPWTFGVTALVLLVFATIASYVPARRAMRMAPLDALRTN